MKCLKCGAGFETGQKYCGSCGQQLKKECPGCGANNPPEHTFCGECGHNLINVGAITLNRSGIITNVNQLFLKLLDQRRDAVLDKPFSLLVYKKDLAPFFTHWNDLVNRSHPQSQEIKLKHRDNKPVHVQIEYNFDSSASETSQLVFMTVTDLSDRQRASDQLQLKDNLINLIFSITRHITAISPPYPEKLIKETLKQICLFTKAQHCFICSLNESAERIETLHQWYSPDTISDEQKNKAISYSLVKRTLSKIRREKSLIIHHVNKLSSDDRNELYTWHSAGLGSLLCHLVHVGNKPVGIIGMSIMDISCDWPQNSIDLLHLAGHILSVVIPRPESPGLETHKQNNSSLPGIDITDNDISSNLECSDITISIDEKPNSVSMRKKTVTAGKTIPKMKFKKDASADDSKVEKLTTRPDGMIWLTCPICGTQENVSPETFDTYGCRLLVQCNCRHNFSIMREQRWYYRKQIHLPGSYKLPKQKRLNQFVIKSWEPMTVIDLSKTGLRFSAGTDCHILLGDHLHVKFKLDNNNKTLIEKPVIVKSINSKDIGCQFLGADQYDVALGFYLL
jgi:hypothetical protein